MKKTTISIFAVFLAAIFNYSFGRSTHDSLTREEPFYITTLVINADVTVVLVNSDKAMLEATGNNAFKQSIRLWKTGDTLLINSKKQKDFYDGTIYVPASHIRRIQVNSNAHVRSLFALEIPNLEVIVNGACDLAVSNIGEVSVTSTDNYSFQENRTVRSLPSSFRGRRNR